MPHKRNNKFNIPFGNSETNPEVSKDLKIALTQLYYASINNTRRASISKISKRLFESGIDYRNYKEMCAILEEGWSKGLVEIIKDASGVYLYCLTPKGQDIACPNGNLQFNENYRQSRRISRFHADTKK